MEYLFTHWNELKDKLSNKSIFMFLDYDGTLVPIVETPDKAVISTDVKELLHKLSKNPACSIAIISGRALKDIKNLVGLKDIIYAGNHGLEIEGPKIRFESQVSPKLKSIIRQIKENLENKLSGIKGVFIEDKGLTISVHYRLVDKKAIPLLENIFTELVKPYTIRDKIKINSGKKVYEVKPPVTWDKGKIVSWLLARQQFAQGEDKVFPIYIGDDVTDEDVFRVLKNKGLTIFVGEPGLSGAQYYLKDTEEVIRFIKQILDLKEQ